MFFVVHSTIILYMLLKRFCHHSTFSTHSTTFWSISSALWKLWCWHSTMASDIQCWPATLYSFILVLLCFALFRSMKESKFDHWKFSCWICQLHTSCIWGNFSSFKIFIHIFRTWTSISLAGIFCFRVYVNFLDWFKYFVYYTSWIHHILLHFDIFPVAWSASTYFWPSTCGVLILFGTQTHTDPTLTHIYTQ